MKKRICGLMMSIVMVIAVLLPAVPVQAAGRSRINGVQYHSAQDIQDYIATLPYSMIQFFTDYAVEPSTTAPYEAGQLSDATLQQALSTINAIRYIAGLDPVELDADYNKLAQHAALVNAANKDLSHYPSQPSGMSDEMYQLGAKGASSSNIAMGYSTIPQALLRGWMNDSDSYNIDRLGHRRWILNPTMQKTGFGIASNGAMYSAMYAFDKSYADTDVRGVSWPAQVMPTNFFAANYAWSISFGEEIPATVRVTLKNENTGQVWNFGYDDPANGNFSISSSDGYFNIGNDSYGQSGCVIFRLNGISSYNAGDFYSVKITGLGTSHFDWVQYQDLNDNSDSAYYTVRFFDLTSAESAASVPVRADSTKATEFVERMYSVVLGREADPDGLEDWVNRLTLGTASAVDIVQGFLCSDEYNNKGKSNGEIVTDCYNAMLGRNPDEDGYNDWVSRLDSGMSVNAIFAGFVGSQEFGNLCASYGISPGTYPLNEARDQNAGVTAFVSRLYTQALGRGYDATGLNDWTGQINANPSRENIMNIATNGFFHSEEFVNKNLDNTEFVKVLYRTYLGREYDDAGLADWVGQLDSGSNDRDGVMRGFAYSPEFDGIMAGYGL